LGRAIADTYGLPIKEPEESGKRFGPKLN